MNIHRKQVLTIMKNSFETMASVQQQGDWAVEITAKDLHDTVVLALMGKNPANGMKLGPRNKRVKEARTRLEWILECANRGRLPNDLPF